MNEESNTQVLQQAVSLLIKQEQKWKSIAEDFASSIVVVPGNKKPRFNIDLEKFLAAQHNYKVAIGDIQ